MLFLPSELYQTLGDATGQNIKEFNIKLLHASARQPFDPSRGSRKGETERPARMKQRAAQCPLYGHGNKTPFIRPAGRRAAAARAGSGEEPGRSLAWTHPRHRQPQPDRRWMD